MKHSLTLALLALSLTGTAQVPQVDHGINPPLSGDLIMTPQQAAQWERFNRIDTLRATLIVYYDGRQPSVLHTKSGFVVRQAYKDNVYLDDRKKVIKAPIEVLTYKLK